MAVTLILAGVGAAAFGTLSLLSAKEQNKAKAEQARNQMRSIDDAVRQNRLSFYDQTSIASQRAMDAEGSYRNSVGFASGLSLSEFFGQTRADIETDQYIRSRNLRKQEEAAQIQKENIAEGAEASMGSPLMAAIQGGVQGAQIGGAIGGAIENLGAASAQAAMVEKQAALADARLGLAEQSLGFNEQLFGQSMELGGLRQQLLNTQIRGAQNSLFFNSYGTLGNPLLGGFR